MCNSALAVGSTPSACRDSGASKGASGLQHVGQAAGFAEEGQAYSGSYWGRHQASKARPVHTFGAEMVADRGRIRKVIGWVSEKTGLESCRSRKGDHRQNSSSNILVFVRGVELSNSTRRFREKILGISKGFVLRR